MDLPGAATQFPDLWAMNRRHPFFAKRASRQSCSMTFCSSPFTARTYLAIAHQSLKAARGNSDDLHRVLLEAESSLTAIAMAG